MLDQFSTTTTTTIEGIIITAIIMKHQNVFMYEKVWFVGNDFLII